ncbi:MAG: AMP-binding protein [Solirubrobacterales bacterium]|nr:AMP-binding protein [Solirubrobacterales bacterium]
MNLALSLLAAAERHGDGEALVDGETRLSYADLQARAAELAGALAQLGLRRGQSLCTLLGNRRETVELYWAAQWLGARFTPLNVRLGPSEVAYCVSDAEAGLVVHEAAAAAGAAACAQDGARLIAVGDTGGAADAIGFETLRGEPHPGALDLADDEISLMLYTSGTTGRPKGVPRSHRADRAGGLSQVIHHGYRYGDRTLGVMPLYHTMGVHSMIAMALIDGCFIAMPQWHAAEAARLIAAERITSLYLAPTLYHDLLGALPADADLSSIEAMGYAGSPMSPALAARCVEAFQARVFFNHYGSTEYYTWAVSRDQATKPGCAGRPAINARLRLVEPDPDAAPDAVVPRGAEGQVIADLRSDEAFSGYWKRPDADERAIRDGWYYPGDIGRLDEDGELWIVGRMDDMIISGGENIHPGEVEAVLDEHPAVQETAVIGVADERWGQRVLAVVVGDGVTDSELDRHVRDHPGLADFKRPREYRFVDALPKNPAGKLLRRQLREELDP